MTHNTKLAVAGVALMLLSVVSFAAPAFGAAPTVDTETTDTTSTSDLTDGAVVTDFTANSSQNISTLEASYDSQNPGVRILDPARDNVTLTSFDVGDMVQTGSATSTYYYSLTMDEGDFTYAETDALANKTMYVQLVNNTQSDDPDLTNISITLEETAGRTVRVVEDSTEGLTTTSSWTVAGYSLPLLSSSDADYEGDSLPTSDNGTVVIHTTNSTLTDDFDSLSSLDAGTWTLGSTIMADGSPLRTYVNEAPDDPPEQYAVIKPGSNDVAIHGLSGDAVDISVSTSALGWLQGIQSFGLDFLGQQVSGIGLSIGGFASGMGLFLFGSIRRRTEA